MYECTCTCISFNILFLTHTCRIPRIIEVEPSVNINDGRSGDIVQVYHNKIVGVVETPIDSDQHSDREMSPSRR